MMKFFGFTLSAPIRCNAESKDYALKGTFDLDTLNDLIHEFIEKFVLCRACGNPETLIRIRSGRVMLKCDACNSITEANNKHKLAAYIIKHKASTTSKYASIAAAKQIDVEEALTGVKASDFDDDSSWAIDTSSEAVAKRRVDALECGK
jgi:translation initiation factor 5